jgi:hypothetical protein
MGHDGPPLRLADRLRKALSAERARLIVQQAELRRRAAEKFVHADRTFFSRVGLEQSTDQWISAYKANRFFESSGAGGELADLCCGIGGDLLGMAARVPATGVERDPVTGIFAEANLAVWSSVHGHPNNSRVETADAAGFDLRSFAAWHIDPDRRPEGRRTTRVEFHDPPRDVIEGLLDTSPNAAIKLAPAAVLPDDWLSRAELEWISRRRECRQLVAWFGGLAKTAGRRRATVLDAEGCVRRTVSDEPNRTVPIAAQIGRYVFEPDPAVLAAKLEGSLAAEHRLSAMAAGVAYFTGDQPLADPALAGFEVLELLPLRRTILKEWLAERGVGQIEIKKRGIEVDPNQLRRQLNLPGDSAAVLLITRIAGRAIVIAARRLVGVPFGSEPQGRRPPSGGCQPAKAGTPSAG